MLFPDAQLAITLLENDLYDDGKHVIRLGGS